MHILGSFRVGAIGDRLSELVDATGRTGGQHIHGQKGQLR